MFLQRQQKGNRGLENRWGSRRGGRGGPAHFLSALEGSEDESDGAKGAPHERFTEIMKKKKKTKIIYTAFAGLS